MAFVHRFGSHLNSHVRFQVLVTVAVFSAGADGEAVFHPAAGLEPADFAVIQAEMRKRGLRCHGHLGDDALHVLDSSEHAGGWSVDASVTIPGRDRQRLQRLLRCCDVLAPNSALRDAVAASAGPAGAIAAAARVRFRPVACDRRLA